MRVGQSDAVDLDSHVSRAGEDVDSCVRVARMCVHRLVLLQPLGHRVPVQPNQIAELLERRIRILERRRARHGGANGDIVNMAVATTRRVVDPSRRDQFGAHVGAGKVVGGVVGLLPNQDWPG